MWLWVDRDTIAVLRKIVRKAENRALERAANVLRTEGGACLGDIVPGDDIGRREANARAGALFTAEHDIRALKHPD